MAIPGFKWQYRDKRGVDHWRGSAGKLLLVMGRGFAGWGVIAGTAGVSLFLYNLLHGFHNPAAGILMGVGLIHGVAFGGSGWWMVRIHNLVKSLSPSTEVCSHLRVDVPRLEQMALEKGIKPRININDIDYYRLDDFYLR